MAVRPIRRDRDRVDLDGRAEHPKAPRLCTDVGQHLEDSGNEIGVANAEQDAHHVARAELDLALNTWPCDSVGH